MVLDPSGTDPFDLQEDPYLRILHAGRYGSGSFDYECGIKAPGGQRETLLDQ